MTKIYLVSNINNNPNKVYIGKTKGNRFYKHTYKFGKQINYNYIDEVNSLNRIDWEPLETYWIEQFKAWGFEVVNIRKKGGSGVNFCTIEHKIKIGNANRHPKPNGFGNKLSINNDRSNKIKQSLAKIDRGPAISEGRKKPIIQLDLNKIKIQEYTSSKDAESETKIKGITNVLTGRAKTAGGYYWEYK